MPVSIVETSAFKRAQDWVRAGELWGIFVLPHGKTVLERSFGQSELWGEQRVIRTMIMQNVDLNSGPRSHFDPSEAEREYREVYAWLNQRGLIKESFRPRRGSLWLLAELDDDAQFEFKMRWL